MSDPAEKLDGKPIIFFTGKDFQDVLDMPLGDPAQAIADRAHELLEKAGVIDYLRANFFEYEKNIRERIRNRAERYLKRHDKYRGKK